MGSIETENYKISFNKRKNRFLDDEPNIERANLTLKSSGETIHIGWMNNYLNDEPVFTYVAHDNTIIGLAKESVGYKGFVDKKYKAEMWYDTENGQEINKKALSRNSTETGYLSEIQYNHNTSHGNSEHLYAERTYTLNDKGQPSKITYNISDLISGIGISFTTDGKGNIREGSLKERKLDSYEIENSIQLGENHFQELKMFFENNHKKNLEKNLENDGKSGSIDIKKLSEKVGALTDGIKLDNLTNNKGIMSAEFLNNKKEIS